MAYSGQVHSVFRQTVNISATDGRLYSIATAQQDNAPCSIRVAAPIPFTEMGIQSGDKVQAAQGKLCVGNITIDIADIALWESVLPAFPARQSGMVLENHTNILRQCIARYGKSGGLRDLWFSSTSSAYQSVFSAVLTESAQNLLAALRKKDFDEAYRRGCELIGLGGGLTPSGDDFCAALLTVINMPKGPFGEKYRRLGYQLADTAIQQTTVISQDMLKLAANGQARENVIAVLREVTGGSPASLEAATLKVLQIGSLSGTDWAVGLTAGLELGGEFAE
ncbi:DUF2877 domain-containing protein [Sporomusa sp.]|uniref:DUF2877 domain-containing protein n=1 Tax=Sporomusa sp. TaxID=2078658 RepID=UPI002B621FBE|nr:DUF2877 domain-containing protein [Sporomusa sp.]HWR45982.1 DUF2877 domain-containing protein [Sporomusa sp.]